MIESGVKTEEYRELKEYWMLRLLFRIKVKKGHINARGDIFDEMFDFSGQEKVFNDFDIIIFKNGYQKNARKIFFEFDGIS